MDAVGTGPVVMVVQPTEMAFFGGDMLLERACELIVDAGKAGAGWVVFPETYLPGGPAWLWHGPAGDVLARELYASALARAVVIPGDVSDRLCRVARRSQVAVAIGLVERDNTSCYSTMLFIDAAGRIRAHYRASLDVGGQQRRWISVSRTVSLPGERLYSPEDWTNVGGI